MPPLVKARDEMNRHRTGLGHALNAAMLDRPEAIAAAEQCQKQNASITCSRLASGKLRRGRLVSAGPSSAGSPCTTSATWW